MPTGAKLTSAICLAIMAMIVSELFKPQMPEGTAFGTFTYVNMAFAFIIGWRTMGRNVGQGLVYALNHGLTAMLALVILLLFLHSSWIMLQNSTKLRYDSVSEAIQSIFLMMMEYGLLLMTPTIITVLLGGALLTGMMAEGASRRWR